MDIIKHEDILLSIQVIVVVPLGGRTCHHPYPVFLRKSVVEYKIIIPQIGKCFVIALIAGRFFYRIRFPVVSRSKVVDKPEFGVITECTFQLQPFGKGDLSGDVCQEVISFCFIGHHVQRTDRVTDASVPLRLLSGTAPTAVLILHRLGGECFHCITDAISSSFFHVRTECQVGSEFQPFINLGIAICLKVETTVINAFHNTGLVKETTGYIVMCFFRTTGVANRIALLHSRAQHFIQPVRSCSQ